MSARELMVAPAEFNTLVVALIVAAKCGGAVAVADAFDELYLYLGYDPGAPAPKRPALPLRVALTLIDGGKP